MGVITGLAIIAAMLLLFICALAVMSRANEPEHEDEEPIGDVVDIRQFLQKWEDK